MTTARIRPRRPGRTIVIGALLAGFVATLPMTVAPTLAHGPGIRPNGTRPAWDTPGATSATSSAASTARVHGAASAAGSRYIVRFRSGIAPLARRAVLTRAGLSHARTLRWTDVGTVQVTGDPTATLAALRADPRVAAVEPDGHNVRFDDPSGEQYFSKQWGLDNTGQTIGSHAGIANIDIDEPEALAITSGSPDVVVAVIDDGVDFTHPDLADRAWTNPGETGTDANGNDKATNGIDDDGNGYVDDVHGWDFCHDDNTVHHEGEDFHGTHVAGILAASLNGQGVVGVAPNVQIMALKFLGSQDCGLDSQAIEAIAYAKHFGVHLANASWGEYARPSQLSALKSSMAHSGMLFIAAAGNETRDNDHTTHPALPASFDLPNVISVAAIDNRGAMATFSNYGKTTVDIAAPGVSILSSVPLDTDYAYGYLSGTSMATPFVTGVAALVLSQAPDLAANLPALRSRLLGSGKADSKTSGKTATGRIIDAFRALDMTPPTASAPASIGFIRDSVMGASSATAHVVWPAATDDATGISGYGVQAQANGGAWTKEVSTTARSYDKTVAFGTAYMFRDRATDGARNRSDFAESATVHPRRSQESTALATWTGSWSSSSSSTASGGRTRAAHASGASVTFSFTGSAVAVVGPKGPTQGKFRVYVDDVYLATYDAHRTTAQAKVVLAVKTWTSVDAHTIRIVVAGTTGHPRIDIDAFLVMG